MQNTQHNYLEKRHESNVLNLHTLTTVMEAGHSEEKWQLQKASQSTSVLSRLPPEIMAIPAEGTTLANLHSRLTADIMYVYWQSDHTQTLACDTTTRLYNHQQSIFQWCWPPTKTWCTTTGGATFFGRLKNNKRKGSRKSGHERTFTITRTRTH